MENMKLEYNGLDGVKVFSALEEKIPFGCTGNYSENGVVCISFAPGCMEARNRIDCNGLQFARLNKMV